MPVAAVCAAALFFGITIAGCESESPTQAAPPPPATAPGAPSVAPGGATVNPAPAPQATPAPPAPPPKQFHLGAAASALATQARGEAAHGDLPQAQATIERALRIEPDNPLLWIELGQLHENAGEHAQADGMGRKALQLASGDPRAMASAWRLIAESLRARGRNEEAVEAEGRANALAAR